MADTCGDCRFWQERHHHFGGQSATGALRGECRRFPPQIVVRTEPPRDWHQRQPDGPRGAWEQRPEHYWPLVKEDQWCGEFKNLESHHG